MERQLVVKNPSMNFNGKKFKPIVNSENGVTTEETIFEYKQDGNIVTATYSGGEIAVGHLIGLVDEHGNIEMRYHQVNTKGELVTGICFSKPVVMDNGKIRLHEDWKWTSGNKSSGQSILEEL